MYLIYMFFPFCPFYPTYLPIHPSIHLSILSIYLSTYLSIYLSRYLCPFPLFYFCSFLSLYAFMFLSAYLFIYHFSPTCQVRVARFYVSSFLLVPVPSSGPQLQARDHIGCCRTRTESRLVPAGPEQHAGPEQQAPDPIGPCRTCTASARSEWPPPDPNSPR